MSEDAPFSEPRRILVVAVLLLASGAVLAAYVAARHLESTRIRLEFERTATDRVHAVDAELTSYIDDLHAIFALFRSSELVTREEFSEFTRPLHARHRGIRAFDWAPLVRGDERDAYERNVRSEFPSFGITDVMPDGSLTSATQRDQYVPIDYIEPVPPGDEVIRGFDLAFHPALSGALFAARDTGDLTVAGPLPLLVDPLDPSGYLVFLPRYGGTVAPRSLTERRQTFLGVIVGVVQLSTMLRDAVKDQRPAAVNVEILDSGQVIALERSVEPEEVRASRAAGAREQLDYMLVDSVDFGDREFAVRCSATPDFVSAHASPLPAIVLAGGIFFLVALLFYSVRLQREIRERRRAHNALRASERRYRVLVEQAPEAIMVYDVEQERLIDANENAARLFKLSRERLLEASLADLSPRLQPDGRSSSLVAKASFDEALAGATPIFPWVHRDSEGRDVPCEVRLVRLPPFDKQLVRASVIDVSERRQAELRQLTMARELDHRVKNNLAEVLALVEQSGTSAGSYEEFREAFAGRVRAMARTHEALAARHWHGVPLAEVVNLTLGPYAGGSSDRIVPHGEPVTLTPGASSALGMTLHELAANAAKYGALAVASGRVKLTWRRAEDGGLEIFWRETGGPAVTTPKSTGFGTRLVEGVVSHELGGEMKMTFEEEGFYCEIRLPPEHVQARDAPA